MKRSEMARVVELAQGRNARVPAFIALLLTHSEDFAKDTPMEICQSMKMSESYVHQVRSFMKIQEELDRLGFKITKK